MQIFLSFSTFEEANWLLWQLLVNWSFNSKKNLWGQRLTKKINSVLKRKKNIIDRDSPKAVLAYPE
jgi:hypothetical protein